MKKTSSIAAAAVSVILLTVLFGCSRTVEDVARWQRTGKEDKLIAALKDPKAEIRKVAATALGEMKSVKAVDPLAALIADPDSEVCVSSTKALISIGNAGAGLHLIDALLTTNAIVKETAASGLGFLKATNAVPALIELLNDTTESVHCTAATALGQIGDEQASAPLAKKLKGAPDALRMEAAKALASTKGAAAVRGLVGALDDANSGVQTAVMDSLVALGTPSVEPVYGVLKADSEQVRRNAVAVVGKLKAVPASGSGSAYIWYSLAQVSIDGKKTLDMGLVRRLAGLGSSATATLLEAVAHRDAEIREHAFRCLEEMGEPCAKDAVAAAEAARDPASGWFTGRTAWKGYPSWRLDVWGAATALNPEFTIVAESEERLRLQARNAFRVMSEKDFKAAREYIPLLIALLGDTTEPPPPQPDVDAFGMPVVRKAIDPFRGVANQKVAQDKLVAAGEAAVFPLIAALADPSETVRNNAAEALGAIGDRRAVAPLMDAMERMLANGTALTESHFYAALLLLDDQDAEPLLLKIRPSSYRAIQVFERHFKDTHVNGAETLNKEGSSTGAVGFRLRYAGDNRKSGEMIVTFDRNTDGEWVPVPPLPDDLP